MIVIGGSEGGIQFAQGLAAMFASYGYAALAVAYFGSEHLPHALNSIPVETIGNAIQWLERQPLVDRNRIGIYGRSKGGELVLLAASMYPQIKFVIVHNPSAYVFEGLKGMSPAGTSSWTHHGQPVPFLPFKYIRLLFYLRFLLKVITKKIIRFDTIYRNSLKDEIRAEQAAIPVEKINGPVLLISATDDVFWPSSLFTQRIEERLKSQQFPHEVIRLDYEGAGHNIQVPYLPTTVLQMNGGAPEKNAVAAEDSWSNILAFVGRHQPTNGALSYREGRSS